jgi:hypothetical protein
MSTTFTEHIIDKIVHTLKDDTIKKKIQLLIIQPFLQYFLELIFPYVIIICVTFGLMIVLMISIIGLLVYGGKDRLNVA